MYLQNKYSQCYYNIINRAKSRILGSLVYKESHHIIPRSLGGNNSKSNLVALTAREHFVCHLLLPKMTTGTDHIKMLHAAWRMCCKSNRGNNTRDYKITSSIYQSLKIKRSDYLKTLVGPLNPNFGNKTGRTSNDFTPEWRAKISASRKGQSSWNKGIQRTSEEKYKISATRKQKSSDPNWNIRPPCSYEKAQKIKEANLGKKWAHNIETKQRKYVSIDDFILLCRQGWTPGLGPKY